MSWREIDRSKTGKTTHVYFRCDQCGRRAISGGHTPTPCVCATKGTSK